MRVAGHMPEHPNPIRIGTAGWPLPEGTRRHFPPGASLLERYAKVFNAVEINSSFYRSHRPDTYRRWADSVPEEFAFSAKLPREITHVRKLKDCDALTAAFAAETGALGPKLKAVLVQLPPSLRFEPLIAEEFFLMLSQHLSASLLCEPRHASWFTERAEGMLSRLGIARVAADPAPVSGAEAPGGASHTAYIRLHGSPRMYYSNYDEVQLLDYAGRLAACRSLARNVWCIFDNTAAFHATPNALNLMRLLDNAPVNARQELPSSL